MSTILERWFGSSVAGNHPFEWFTALVILLIVAMVTRTVQGFVVGRLEKAAERTNTQLDDLIIEVAQATRFISHLALGLLVAREYVHLNRAGERWSHIYLVVAIGLQVGFWAQKGVQGGIALWSRGKEKRDATMASGMRFLAQILIWSIVILSILSNLGFELSAVVAGLGVGGVATALAVQSTLGDLIAGISMYFDRPFDIGDTIAFDVYRGTVEKIGLRSTHLRSIDGEHLVFANGDLARARLRNYARMKERRIVWNFGLEYSLTADQLELAIGLLRDTFQDQEGLRFERAHLKAFGPSAIEVELVYFFLSSDFGAMMDRNQALLLQVYRGFAAQGIRFAYPTQTLYLRKEQALVSEG